VVKLADSTGGAVFYEWQRPPCVYLSFFNGGRQVKDRNENVMCEDPTVPGAGSVCCGSTSSQSAKAASDCRYTYERVKYQTNVDRCAA